MDGIRCAFRRTWHDFAKVAYESMADDVQNVLLEIFLFLLFVRLETL